MEKLVIVLVYRDPDSDGGSGKSAYLYLRRFEKAGVIQEKNGKYRPDFLTTNDLDQAYLFNNSKGGLRKAERRIDTILHEIGDYGLAGASVEVVYTE